MDLYASSFVIFCKQIQLKNLFVRCAFSSFSIFSFILRYFLYFSLLGIPSISSDPYDLVEGETVNYKCEARFGGPSETSTDHYPKLKMYLRDIQLNEQLPESGISYKADIHHLIMVRSIVPRINVFLIFSCLGKLT